MSLDLQSLESPQTAGGRDDLLMMMIIIIIIIIPTLCESWSPEPRESSNCGWTRRPPDAKRNSWHEQEMFHFSKTSRPTLGHTHLIFNRYRGYFKEVKQPRPRFRISWAIYLSPLRLHAVYRENVYLQTQLQYKFIHPALCFSRKFALTA